MNFLVKTHDRGMSGTYEFATQKDREVWLYKEGFFESGGVWRHLDGRIVGLISRTDSKTVYDNCHRPIKHRNVTAALVGLK